MTVALAALGAAALTSGRRLAPAVCVALVVAAVGGVFAVVALAAGVGVFALWRRARLSDRSARATKDADLMCVEITSLGVAAGLTFREAATTAARTVGASVGTRLVMALRMSSVEVGARTGLPGVDAMLAEQERSARTGAPLVRSLDVLASSLRRERTQEARERLARLPIKLLFPLALLILPGFVLMTVGPAVLSGLSRIGL
ncbi:MAG: type II secretion system F family protein [Acidimicrobiia bacterium]